MTDITALLHSFASRIRSPAERWLRVIHGPTGDFLALRDCSFRATMTFELVPCFCPYAAFVQQPAKLRVTVFSRRRRKGDLLPG